MGNRHTVTTLNAREIDTVMSCLRKLEAIMLRRFDKPNEAVGPIYDLQDVLSLLERITVEVDNIRVLENERF